MAVVAEARKTGNRDIWEAAADSGGAISIDHPYEGEIIESSRYSLRINAEPDAIGVEISVNGSDWQPCREVLGFWWYEWHGYSAGDHVLAARAEKSGGEFRLSPPRRFRVKF